MFIKFIASITVFVEIGFFGYLPYIWKNIGHNKRVMSIVNCFASGLFLALGFLHILPEANDQLAVVFGQDSVGTFQHHPIPWGSVISIFTFIGVLTIEIIVNNYLKDKELADHFAPLNQIQGRISISSNKQMAIGSNISSVILIQLALSIHSFIECLSLGSQSHLGAAITLFIGIGCHKWAQGLTLGFTYRKCNFSPNLAFYFCLFHAILNGGAVIIGWILADEASEAVSGVLGAVSAGTFFYISTVQKIHEQFKTSQNAKQKIAFMIVGVVFVILIL